MTELSLIGNILSEEESSSVQQPQPGPGENTTPGTGPEESSAQQQATLDYSSLINRPSSAPPVTGAIVLENSVSGPHKFTNTLVRILKHSQKELALKIIVLIQPISRITTLNDL